VRAGLDVEVLAMGDPNLAPPGVVARSFGTSRLPKRAGLAAVLPWLARGRVLIAFEPATAVAAVPVARVRRRRIVIDVFEDYVALLHDRTWARGVAASLALQVARAAVHAAERADLTTVADEHVPPLRARRRLVVRNLPDPALLPTPGAPDDEPRAIYIGDVRRSRGLFTMLNGLSQAPGWILDIVGPVAAAEKAELGAWMAAHPEDAARVRFHGRLGPEAAWRKAQGAWAGLSLLEDTPAFRAAMPSKVYEYLACGLPVVATDLPRQQALLDAHRCGVVVPAGAGASEGMGAALRGWVENPGSHRTARVSAAEAGAAYRVQGNYAAFAAEICRLVG
jgi:glycosyltransferase involved in cell wall biosynthesis